MPSRSLLAALLTAPAALIGPDGGGDSGRAGLAGIEIGMPERVALAALKSRDPLAYVGPVCSGKNGVGGMTTQFGQEWQVGAHVDGPAVAELLFLSRGPAGSPAGAACSGAVEARIVEALRRRHPSWRPTSYRAAFGVDGHTLMMRGPLPGGTTLDVISDRGDGPEGLCTFTISYARSGPRAPSAR